MFESHICWKIDSCDHYAVAYPAADVPTETKYSDWKDFILVMLFLSQMHNEFLTFTGSETFTKTSPLASKSAGKALGLKKMDNQMGRSCTLKQKGRWPMCSSGKKKRESTQYGWWRTAGKITNSCAC